LVDEVNAPLHNLLGRNLGIDVAAWWRPTAANYFGRVRKSAVLETLEAIGGTDLKNRYANAKKGDIAAAAEKLCAGASIVEANVREAALAWVPDVMLFSTEAGIAADAGAPGADTEVEAIATAADDADGDDLEKAA
jgi:ParB family chromosome partitioning protein